MGNMDGVKGTLLNLAIGQGELLVTPIQILNYINLISTKGNSPSCHFVMVDNLPINSKPKIEEEHWDQVHDGLSSAIISKKEQEENQILLLMD